MPLSTIGSNQITDGAIAVADVADGSITTAKIADDAVTGAKIENNPTIAGNLAVSGTANITGVTTLAENIVFSGSSKGVHLGVTSATASNLLDDYEEGTWTPAFTNNGGIVVSNDTQYGRFTKIGQLVTCSFFIKSDLSNLSAGSGNTVMFSGLPFTSRNDGNAFQEYPANIHHGQIVNLNENYNIVARVPRNSTTLNLRIIRVGTYNMADLTYGNAFNSSGSADNREFSGTFTFEAV